LAARQLVKKSTITSLICLERSGNNPENSKVGDISVPNETDANLSTLKGNEIVRLVERKDLT
jgi:hypothetical protein